MSDKNPPCCDLKRPKKNIKFSQIHAIQTCKTYQFFAEISRNQSLSIIYVFHYELELKESTQILMKIVFVWYDSRHPRHRHYHSCYCCCFTPDYGVIYCRTRTRDWWTQDFGIDTNRQLAEIADSGRTRAQPFSPIHDHTGDNQACLKPTSLRDSPFRANCQASVKWDNPPQAPKIRNNATNPSTGQARCAPLPCTNARYNIFLWIERPLDRRMTPKTRRHSLRKAFWRWCLRRNTTPDWKGVIVRLGKKFLTLFAHKE